MIEVRDRQTGRLLGQLPERHFPRIGTAEQPADYLVYERKPINLDWVTFKVIDETPACVRLDVHTLAWHSHRVVMLSAPIDAVPLLRTLSGWREAD